MKAKEFLKNRFGKDAWDFELDNFQPLRPSMLIALIEEYQQQQINLSLGGVSDSEIKNALSIILKVGSSMLINGISSNIDDWCFPKRTAKKTMRKVVDEADKWNDIQRRRAIKLKNAYDVLSKHCR